MPRAHDEIRELLPWWANGTLEADERRAVEAHLAGCPACRAEAADERRLVEMLVDTAEQAPLPHPGRLERLMERLDPIDQRDPLDLETTVAPVPAERPAASTGAAVARRPAGWLGSVPALRRMVAAQAAALLLLAGLVFALPALRTAEPPAAPAASESSESPSASAEATFRTLGAAPAAPAVPARRQVRVVFAPDTPEAALREILLAVRGRLVDGPSPLGAYTVVLPDGPAAEPLPLVLDHLRRRAEVRLAEPVAGGGE